MVTGTAPADLEATGWLKKARGIVHAPQAATCNGKVYDCFVVDATISHNVQGTYVIGDAGLTPHSPARLVFRGGKRRVMVRQLKTQASLPAVLPHGPIQQQDDPFDPLVEMYRTTEQNYTDLTKRTLSILQGLTGQVRDPGGSGTDGGGHPPGRGPGGSGHGGSSGERLHAGAKCKEGQ